MLLNSMRTNASLFQSASREERLHIAGPVPLDQEVRQDVRIDDYHRAGGAGRYSRPEAIAVSMSAMVTGRRALSRTGLGRCASGVSSDAAAMPASSSVATVSFSF